MTRPVYVQHDVGQLDSCANCGEYRSAIRDSQRGPNPIRCDLEDGQPEPYGRTTRLPRHKFIWTQQDFDRVERLNSGVDPLPWDAFRPDYEGY